jgi:uncharacterized protein involved in cysteine biosynthesis
LEVFIPVNIAQVCDRFFQVNLLAERFVSVPSETLTYKKITCIEKKQQPLSNYFGLMIILFATVLYVNVLIKPKQTHAI